MENKKEVKKCCICGKELTEYGNNPRPYKEEGEACNECNEKYVIPSRIEAIKKEKENI